MHKNYLLIFTCAVLLTPLSAWGKGPANLLHGELAEPSVEGQELTFNFTGTVGFALEHKCSEKNAKFKFEGDGYEQRCKEKTSEILTHVDNIKVRTSDLKNSFFRSKFHGGLIDKNDISLADLYLKDSNLTPLIGVRSILFYGPIRLGLSESGSLQNLDAKTLLIAMDYVE